jgi:NTP pyrophosphatase (non-canonical NTP hydrolase)
MALGGEVGELFELFQWKGDEEISSMLASDEGRRQIEEEIADIAIYLLRIAQQADIDLARAIRDKFRVNEAKYPVEMAKGSAKKYSELGNS